MEQYTPPKEAMYKLHETKQYITPKEAIYNPHERGQAVYLCAKRGAIFTAYNKLGNNIQCSVPLMRQYTTSVRKW